MIWIASIAIFRSIFTPFTFDSLNRICMSCEPQNTAKNKRCDAKKPTNITAAIMPNTIAADALLAKVDSAAMAKPTAAANNPKFLRCPHSVLSTVARGNTFRD